MNEAHSLSKVKELFSNVKLHFIIHKICWVQQKLVILEQLAETNTYSFIYWEFYFIYLNQQLTETRNHNCYILYIAAIKPAAYMILFYRYYKSFMMYIHLFFHIS